MIRWERQEDGGWQGFSGELLVATVTKDESADREQWLWSITALKRPKGWRKGAGHRISATILKVHRPGLGVQSRIVMVHHRS
jgi:hypothetical protein